MKKLLIIMTILLLMGCATTQTHHFIVDSNQENAVITVNVDIAVNSTATVTGTTDTEDFSFGDWIKGLF